jgi:spore germination protein GerM
MLVAVAVLSVGCGLSTSDEPERLGTNNMTDEPPSSDPAADATATPNGSATETAEVWFFQSVGTEDPQLIVETRVVTAPADADDLLLALADGPTATERNDDVVTFVPADAQFGDTELRDNGVMTVRLPDEFYPEGNAASYAFAQVVYTLTGLDGVDQVLFTSESEGAQPVDGAGTTRDGPLGRSDYDNLEPAG